MKPKIQGDLGHSEFIFCFRSLEITTFAVLRNAQFKES
jgi:hypothetical protein